MKRPHHSERRPVAACGLVTLGAVLTLACAQQQPYYPGQPPGYPAQQPGAPGAGQYPPPGYPPPQQAQQQRPPRQQQPPGYGQQQPGYPPNYQQPPQQQPRPAQYAQRPGYPPPGQPGYPPPAQPGYPPPAQPAQPGYPPPAQPGYPAPGQPGAYPPPGYGPPGAPPGYGQPDMYGYNQGYDATAYSHDGFFMRGGAIGLGYQTVPGTNVDGLALTLLDLAVGYSVIPNLAIFGELVLGPGFRIGPGISYYLMPLNMYFGGGLMLQSYKANQYSSTISGFGIQAQAGKEWWVAPQFGIGVGGTLNVGIMDGYNPVSFVTSFIATFN